jgi:hypothetical protein
LGVHKLLMNCSKEGINEQGAMVIESIDKVMNGNKALINGL